MKFIVLALLSGFIMVVDYRQDRLQPVLKALQLGLYPLQTLVDIPSRLTNYTQEFFTEHKTLTSKNRELSTFINIYAAKDQKYHSIQEENQRLRAQLNAIPAARETFTLAEILSVSSNPFSKDVTINKGANSGVFIGQVALVGKAIYGQVKSLTPTSAVIMQLTDIKHAIPVRNERTGLGALAAGTGKTNKLELKHVEASVDVLEGDIFVSSGLGQLFPPDFPVARVEKVDYNPGDSFMSVRAGSIADFNKTREILLIWRADYAREAEARAKEKAKAKEKLNKAKLEAEKAEVEVGEAESAEGDKKVKDTPKNKKKKPKGNR